MDLGTADQAWQVYANELHEHIALVDRTLDMARRAFEAALASPVMAPIRLGIAASLATRVLNDLACVRLLAVAGYPIQAASLVAGIYEAYHTIVVVEPDEQAAERWITHSDPKRPWMTTKELTRSSMDRLGVADMVSKELETYMEFCMAKHSHPAAHTNYAHRTVQGIAWMSIGPLLDEAAVKVSWMALQYASFYGIRATNHFIVSHSDHLPKQMLADFERETHELLALHNHLNQLGCERFMTTEQEAGTSEPLTS